MSPSFTLKGRLNWKSFVFHSTKQERCWNWRLNNANGLKLSLATINSSSKKHIHFRFINISTQSEIRVSLPRMINQQLIPLSMRTQHSNIKDLQDSEWSLHLSLGGIQKIKFHFLLNYYKKWKFLFIIYNPPSLNVLSEESQRKTTINPLQSRGISVWMNARVKGKTN